MKVRVGPIPKDAIAAFDCEKLQLRLRSFALFNPFSFLTSKLFAVNGDQTRDCFDESVCLRPIHIHHNHSRNAMDHSLRFHSEFAASVNGREAHSD